MKRSNSKDLGHILHQVPKTSFEENGRLGFVPTCIKNFSYECPSENRTKEQEPQKFAEERQDSVWTRFNKYGVMKPTIK